MTTRKGIAIIFASVLFLLLVRPASATLILDTGTSTSWPDVTGDPVLDPGQWLAGRFSVSEIFRINSIEGYLSSASYGGTFSVALYSDGGSVPGNLLYLTGASATSVIFDNLGNAIPGWFGPSNLDWLLVPGNYWVAFEVRGDNTFSGFMANPAPNPLAFEAISSGISGIGAGRYVPESAFVGSGIVDIGVRISAVPVPVPEPGSTSLISTGVALMLPWVRRARREHPGNDSVLAN